MPFIRYETGDRGILKTDHICKCGNKSPVLIVLSGRSSDFITLENGEKLNSYVLINIIEYTNESMSSAIKQFQIIQTAVNCFNVNLVIKRIIQAGRTLLKNAFG